jgi:hypothetical protein
MLTPLLISRTEAIPPQKVPAILSAPENQFAAPLQNDGHRWPTFSRAISAAVERLRRIKA